MTTDPNMLTNLARCYSCIPKGRFMPAWIALLCRWANAGGVPEVPEIAEHDLINFSSIGSGKIFSTLPYTPTANSLVLAVIWNRVAVGTAATAVSVTGNGLTWVLVETQLFVLVRARLSVFRSMGAAPVAGGLSVDFGGTAQDGCIMKVLEFSNVDTSGANGSGAVVQSANTAALASADPTLSLAPLDPSGRNAIVAFSGNAQSPYDGVPEAGWVENLDMGEFYGGFDLGAYITYQLDSTDDTIAITAALTAWGLIGLEIKAI